MVCDMSVFNKLPFLGRLALWSVLLMRVIALFYWKIESAKKAKEIWIRNPTMTAVYALEIGLINAVLTMKLSGKIQRPSPTKK